MKYYITRSRYDHQPHIYESNIFHHKQDDPVYDWEWDGLVIRIDALNLDIQSHEIGAEFDLLGRRWLIIDFSPASLILTCAIATTEGYRLLLHQLIFQTELGLMMRLMWCSMPKYMREECWNDYMLQRNN